MKYFLVKYKYFFAFYLIWIFILFCLLLLYSDKQISRCKSKLFPFPYLEDIHCSFIETYDLTEFLIYGIIPLIVFFVIFLLKLK